MELRRDEAGAGRDAWGECAQLLERCCICSCRGGRNRSRSNHHHCSSFASLGESEPRRSVQRLQLASKGLANGNYNRESVSFFVCVKSQEERRDSSMPQTHTHAARPYEHHQQQKSNSSSSTAPPGTSFHPVVTTASPTSIAPSTPLHRRTTAAAHILLALVPSALSHRQN